MCYIVLLCEHTLIQGQRLKCTLEAFVWAYNKKVDVFAIHLGDPRGV